MNVRLLQMIGAAGVLSAMTAPANASMAVETQAPRTDQQFSQFEPASDRIDHRIDYKHWDEALRYFVVPMGPSVRDGARRVEPRLGTRLIYGHTSRYRLEGNRLAFSFLTDQMRNDLTEYRRDLERVGSELDLTSLPRNEQLAFWLNLHNVAVIEALALAYPIRQPRKHLFGSNDAQLDDAQLVTVDGVELSPRDIREQIVFANWKDPKVIYGFWRGEIGGPSIQRFAFTGDNVDALLSYSAEEFVNSLRGLEKFSGKVHVSRIYEEAAPYYFADWEALRDHITPFARDNVKQLLDATPLTAYNRYDPDIADLARGVRDPAINAILSTRAENTIGARAIGANGLGASPVQSRYNLAILRLMEERREKLYRAYKQGIRMGMVIYGDGQYADGGAAREVE